MDGEPLEITDTMIEEERRLEEERAKEEMLELEKMQKESSKMGSSMFNKLDELLSQTQLYSEFLLEKMDDIALNGIGNGALEQPNGKKGTTIKRKGQGGRGRGTKRLKEGREVIIPKHEEDNVKQEDTLGMTEEERVWKEQMEIAPLLTGGALKSYQIKGVKWMISLWQNGLNGILADQMGLGKTVQTIGFLAHLKGMGMHGPFLICAPLSTLSNWVSEVKRWAPSMHVLLYHGSKDERIDLRRKSMPYTITDTFPVVVTSFEIVIRDRRFLSQYKWKYIVVDEGHRLKNFDCKLLRELRQIPAANTLLLTGTPLQNNLAELWSLLNFILPDIFTSMHEFQSWFDFSGRQSNGMKQEEIDEKKRLQVISKLHLILRPFLLRRLKGEVEKGLPQKKEIILYACMTEQQKQFQEHLINKTLVEFLEEKSSTPGAMTKSRLNNIVMQLRKNCNHPDLLSSQFDDDVNWPPVETLLNQCGKLKLLDRLLSHLKKRGHKVLIFSQMTRILDLLEYYLQERGLEPCRIDGSVKQIDRQEQIRDFNSEGKKFVFLLSTRAGGLGINLTSADTVIIYDSDWNPHVDMQAMDRCHRIGQTRPVHVYRLATAHSIECRMLKVANNKLKLEHLVIEKGQFRQERDHPKTTLEESDLLNLLKQERDEEEEFVQSAEISEENLLKMLERHDLVADCFKTNLVSQPFPLQGPGWEVVTQKAAGTNLLSSIEGYSNFSPAVKQEQE
ncbi:hypothetical protein O6H91_21G045300 [Diphasiastrum complanatum]|nr:hypothetical protein O6H91_21G045300 [Diphasiastrum complanatum]KAJ7517903.1 hypothetical protein O6H91_21G045300 [Diphasiastrum complanatum]KAJ7517904.1 hypothetical protein O6H91_21G045300 [Diphasiastrum complanatum]